MLLAAVDEELGAVFFGPPDIDVFRARFGVPGEWSARSGARRTVCRCTQDHRTVAAVHRAGRCSMCPGDLLPMT
jgi:hypothetical protein